MRNTITVIACVVLLAGVGRAAAEERAYDVIAKYVEARGGREAWQAIESMELTGEFTAFSKVGTFTLQRKRGDLYHLDHTMRGQPVVIGYDGETYWWDHPFRGKGAREIQGVDLEVVMRDVEMRPPLFDHEEKGFEVTLLGEVEVDGIPAIGIELTRGADSKETWYLDPETYLEIARDSPGSDFGQPNPQRTWFDDFREIEGIKVPFFVESQWYTRHREFVVESIEINIPIDDAVFQMPAPIGMGPFQPLIGSWQVSVQQRGRPDGEFSSDQRRSTIEPILRGALLQEQFTTSRGDEVFRTLSYDEMRETYRMTEISSSNSYLDILQGELDESGRLTVSNKETGTPMETGRGTYHGRVAIFDVTDGGFTLELELSTDGGETWWVASKETYEPAADLAQGDYE